MVKRRPGVDIWMAVTIVALAAWLRLVHLTCYNVLRAEEALSAAHGLLQERAHKIGDERLRRSYLETVAAHREIIAAWQQRSHA